MYANQSHARAEIQINKLFFTLFFASPLPGYSPTEKLEKNNQKGPELVLLCVCVYKATMRLFILTVDSVNRLQQSPWNHRRLQMMSDMLGKCKNTALYVRVRFKGHIQKEAPPTSSPTHRDRKAVVPPWSLRKSGEKVSAGQSETGRGVRTAGSRCHWLVVVQKGQMGRPGSAVRSIALDFGSADRTRSVRLQRKSGSRYVPWSGY